METEELLDLRKGTVQLIIIEGSGLSSSPSDGIVSLAVDFY
jgi:hypothetical protein